MNYTSASLIRDKNLGKIGQTNDFGFQIDDIIVVPTDEQNRRAFMNDYIVHGGVNQAYYSDNEDYEVWAVDLKNLDESGRIFYAIL